jgi:four helix bundle protein
LANYSPVDKNMQNYRDLKFWQKAHTLTLALYKETRTFPREELFGLTSQIRRASASIGANIAEGCGRYGRAEFARFLNIALGSACELDYHILLAKDLGYLRPEQHKLLERDLAEIRRMLVGFLQKLTPDA